MENQYKQTGKRLEEIRQVLEIPVSEMAALTEMSEEEYLQEAFLRACRVRDLLEIEEKGRDY